MSVYNAIRYNNSYANAGGLVLLSTQTASSSASVSFTSGIDSTYKEYMFIFNNIHPQNDEVNFQFNGSTDGGSNYNVTKTTTYFRSGHEENDSATYFDYLTGHDLAQSTANQDIAFQSGNDNDQSVSGFLHLFEPSSTTFVKHFICTVKYSNYANRSFNNRIAGYANTTSTVDAIQFSMSSGNIDDGTIQMFGVVK